MSGKVLNCKKCQRIFQRRLSDLCPDCVKQEDDQFVILYRALQKTAAQGGIALDALALQMNIPAEAIEQMYLEGRLGMAGVYLKIPCQACRVLTHESERKGRFCVRCSEETANKAKVDVKSLRDLVREEDEEKRRQAQLRILKTAPPPSKEEPQQFGFTMKHI
jgi:hypothetical protein